MLTDIYCNFFQLSLVVQLLSTKLFSLVATTFCFTEGHVFPLHVTVST